MYVKIERMPTFTHHPTFNWLCKTVLAVLNRQQSRANTWQSENERNIKSSKRARSTRFIALLKKTSKPPAIGSSRRNSLRIQSGPSGRAILPLQNPLFRLFPRSRCNTRCTALRCTDPNPSLRERLIALCRGYKFWIFTPSFPEFFSWWPWQLGLGRFFFYDLGRGWLRFSFLSFLFFGELPLSGHTNIV